MKMNMSDMKLPDDKDLNIMWNVSTSSAIESETKPHLIFARLLYHKITNQKLGMELAND